MLYQQPTIKKWQQSRKEAKARKNQRGTKVQTQLGTDIVQQLLLQMWVWRKNGQYFVSILTVVIVYRDHD